MIFKSIFRSLWIKKSKKKKANAQVEMNLKILNIFFFKVKVEH